jgi:hypothetical protein
MTLEDQLKAAGQTPEQIAEIVKTLGPSRAIFETVLTTAERANADAAAKLAQATEKETKINKFWNEQATPEINEAYTRATTAETRAAAAEAERDQLRRSARQYGFIPEETAEEKTARETREAAARGGETAEQKAAREAAARGSTAGAFTEAQIIDAIAGAATIGANHLALFGTPLLDLRDIINDAGKRKMKAEQVWEEKYKVPDKRAELAAAAKKAERDAIEKEVTQKVQKEFADKYGNENTAPLRPSRFPSYAKDATTGAPDKQAWTRPDKREKLRQRIHEQVAKETGTVH